MHPEEPAIFTRVACLLGVFITFPSVLLARPVDLSIPLHQFESVTWAGHLEVWREVATVDFGRGLVLPLRVGFTSQPHHASPHLGKSWMCPLLDANVTQLRDDLLQVNLLCGKALYLQRHEKDPARFQTLDHEWHGERKGEVFRLFRQDGWELLFEEGRVQRLRTDDGRILTWSWNGKTVVQVQEPGSESPLKFEIESEDGLTRAFVVNGKRYLMTLARPSNEVPSASLLSITWPGGTEEKYSQSFPRHQVGELVLKTHEGRESRYTFDVRTGHILSDGKWAYEVGEIKGSDDRPLMTRTNQAGEKESYHFDAKNGTGSFWAADGTTTQWHLITTPGPNYQRVARVEHLAGGEVRTLYRAAYDEEGRLARETDAAGITWLPRYDDRGNLVDKVPETIRDPEVLAQLAKKENELLRVVEMSESAYDRDDALQELGCFYSLQMREPRKAEALALRITNPQQRFNVLFFAISGDITRKASSKIEGYRSLIAQFPDKKEFLESRIQLRQEEMKHENSRP